MEYKRLTDSITAKSMAKYGNLINPYYVRLAELEDKIEQGTLIELPCKVGDIVYFPIVDRFDYAEIENIHITAKEIIFEWAQYDRSYELTEVWDDGYFTIDDIGKTVFLTREEAEKRLKELQE